MTDDGIKNITTLRSLAAQHERTRIFEVKSGFLNSLSQAVALRGDNSNEVLDFFSANLFR